MGRHAHKGILETRRDSGMLQHLRDGGGTERALPVAADPHHGTVGPKSLPSDSPSPARHEETPLSSGSASVCLSGSQPLFSRCYFVKTC